MDVFELLQTLLQVELTTRRTNLVQARSFAEILERPLRMPHAVLHEADRQERPHNQKGESLHCNDILSF